VAPREAEPGQWRLDITGTGFGSGCVVHVARWTGVREWQYFAAEIPIEETATHLSIRTRALGPGEYVAVIRDIDGVISTPMNFVLLAAHAYSMPVGPRERWTVTQGPNGAFSHWNRSRKAWDIAPRQGRWVLAMRAGTVHTHDLGMGQTPRVRSFGNYISIDHGDGEYSHYAHLATPSISAQSIPFHFNQQRDGRLEQGGRYTAMSKWLSGGATCWQSLPEPQYCESR
jgi:hypothetical protein